MKIRLNLLICLWTISCLGWFTLARASSPPKADDTVFFQLDWQQMPLDSAVPHYEEVIPLQSDYRTHDYRVSLLYPEWQEMTKTESQKMKQWQVSVREDLDIHTHVGISRGEGVLDVDFVPVVQRNGKYYKLLSAKMEIEAVPRTQMRFAPSVRGGSAAVRRYAPTTAVKDRYARESKLASGKWVKVSIKEDGIYRLTRSALSKMGFKNPDKVHLYGHGGHRLSEKSQPEQEYDDLQEVPLFQANKDTWLFWGNGLVHWEGDTRIFNPYAREACYFLREEDTSSSIETVDCLSPDKASQAKGNVLRTFTDHLLYEKDEFAWASLGRNLYDAVDYKTSNSRTYKLSTRNHSTQGDAALTVAFTASANSETWLTPTVNGTKLSAMRLPQLGEFQAATGVTKTYPVGLYNAGSEWTINLSSTAGHSAHLDYLALHYTRDISAVQNFVMFQGASQQPATYQVSHFDETQHRVMRIGEAGSPAVLVKGTLTQDVFSFGTDDASRRYVCFNTTYAYPQPTVVGTVENQNLHAMEAQDMVILIPESGKLLEQANRLAEAHRTYDGLRTVVVRADQVYNEFSSGTPDATAYRRLMKMLYDRADGKEEDMPRYLLLMGDCSFDNRMLTLPMRDTNPKDYLLCFESENSFSDTQSYILEEYFGFLDDGEGAQPTRDKTDLGVGRFPVHTPEQAKAMVDKTIAFISNQYAGAWKNKVMVLGDDGDNNYHMIYANEAADRILKYNPEMEVKKVMWDAYKRVSTLSTNTYPEVKAVMKQQLADGVLLVNYVGHAAPYVFSTEAVWQTQDFQEFKGTRLPVWFTAACDVTPFDSRTTNLGVEAVRNEGGGALAMVGTTRTVFASNNRSLNLLFTQYVFGKDKSGRRYRLGDALRLSKVSLIGTEVRNLENKLQYCLLGDPALVLGAPLNRVEVELMKHGKTDETCGEFRAGMPVCIEGRIVGADGKELPNFKGIVSARIYDIEEKITCRRNDPSVRSAFEFTDRTSLLCTVQDSVQDGRFSFTFIVPKDIKYTGGTGRMVLYAISDDLKTEANGYSEDFTVGGSETVMDQAGPKMELTLNGEYGGTVNASPYFVAQLQDESGVNITGNGVGHDIVLSIDNRPEWTYVLNDYYKAEFGDFTKGTLAFTIPTLPEGNHTLTLRAWDVLNNTSTASMDFTVDASYQPSILRLAASPSPAVTTTNFLLAHDLPGSDVAYLIEVFDFNGRLLWSKQGYDQGATGGLSIPWNLSVGAGYGRIVPGIYLYRATIQSGGSKYVTKTQKLIVN